MKLKARQPQEHRGDTDTGATRHRSDLPGKLSSGFQLTAKRLLLAAAEETGRGDGCALRAGSRLLPSKVTSHAGPNLISVSFPSDCPQAEPRAAQNRSAPSAPSQTPADLPSECLNPTTEPLSGPSCGRPNNNDPKGCPCHNSLSPYMAKKELGPWDGIESGRFLAYPGDREGPYGAPRRWGDAAASQRTPGATRGWEKQERPFPDPGGSQTASLRNLGRMCFCSFKPPSLQSLVMAPMGALKEKAGFLGTGISQALSVNEHLQCRRHAGTPGNCRWGRLGRPWVSASSCPFLLPRRPKQLQGPA